MRVYVVSPRWPDDIKEVRAFSTLAAAHNDCRPSGVWSGRTYISVEVQEPCPMCGQNMSQSTRQKGE